MANKGGAAKTSKVGGKSTGTNAPMKKDGYASGRVPKSMIGSKGKQGLPYDGPNVQHGSFK